MKHPKPEDMLPTVLLFDGSALGKWEDRSWLFRKLYKGCDVFRYARESITVPSDYRARLLIVTPATDEAELCQSAKHNGGRWEWWPTAHVHGIPEYAGELPEQLRKLWRYLPGVKGGNPPTAQGSLF